MLNKKIDVIIPTCKPGEEFVRLLEQLERQTVRPHRIILMNTEKVWIEKFLADSRILEIYDNIELHHVTQEEFDHGKTRDLGVQFSEAPYFLCMTQDAMPADEYLIENLLRGFVNEQTAVVYGRQLARADSHILEEYARQFNYPSQDRLKTKADLPKLGIKTYFCSNVCAMYRRDIYDALGGFIKKTIFNEDMIYAAGVIAKDKAVYYAAKAQVIHSHHYTGRQQFHRNFDLGVSQADHPEIFAQVPSEKEGGRLVSGTIRYLFNKKKAVYILPFIWQCGCKFLGYRLGKAYKYLPKMIVRACSMNRNYWKF